MTLARLAWANLRATPITSALNVILLALGTATIVVLLLASHQFSETLARDADGIDLVLGAKGSPIQLVLSTVYHADVPTGNIPLHEAQRWSDDRRVAHAIPLSLGDSAEGFRIVGTTHEYPSLYGAETARGRLWEAPLEAVVGAEVARIADLAPGDTLTGAHGLSAMGDLHAEAPYRVVGVLAPTGAVIDRLILTSLESVWDVHGIDHDHGHGHDEAEAAQEITAMLVGYASPIAAASLPRQINAQSNLQAASPAFELARMLQVLGLGVEGLRAFALILIASAALSVFGAMYGALRSRRGELAMMRCLGGTRGELMASLLIEGLILGLIGTAVGMLVGHTTIQLIGSALAESRGVTLTGATLLLEELWLAAAMILVALLAAAIPAWQAYRTDVSRALAHRG